MTYFIVDGAAEDGANVCSTVAIDSPVQRLTQCQATGHDEESKSTRQSLPQVWCLRLHVRHQASTRRGRDAFDLKMDSCTPASPGPVQQVKVVEYPVIMACHVRAYVHNTQYAHMYARTCVYTQRNLTERGRAQ